MNNKGLKATNRFIDTMIVTCIVINLFLISLSLTLGDEYLFKIAALSAALLLLSRIYRHYEQKEEDKE